MERVDVTVAKYLGHGTWSNCLLGTSTLSVKVRVDQTPDGSIAFGYAQSTAPGMDVTPGQNQAFLPVMWLGHTQQFYVNNVAVGAGARQPPAMGALATGDVIEMTLKDSVLTLTRTTTDGRVEAAVFPDRLNIPYTAGGMPTQLQPGVALSNVGDTVTFLGLPPLDVVRGGGGVVYRTCATSEPGAGLVLPAAHPLPPSPPSPPSPVSSPSSSSRPAGGAAYAKVSAWCNPGTANLVPDEDVIAALRAAATGQPQLLTRAVLGIDERWPGVKRVSEDPRVYTIDNFLSPEECDNLVEMGTPFLRRSAVVSTGAAGGLSERRSSQTCYLSRTSCPELLGKASRLLNKPATEMELPQVARYTKDQRYDPHQDAFNISEPSGQHNVKNGGQRLGTLLVYLNDVNEGGCTYFVHLGIRIRPKKCMALVFFPCFADGSIDLRMLHSGESAVEVKWLCQVWIRQDDFRGISSADAMAKAQAQAALEANATSGTGGVAIGAPAPAGYGAPPKSIYDLREIAK